MSGFPQTPSQGALWRRLIFALTLLSMMAVDGQASAEQMECTPGLLPKVLVYAELSVEEMARGKYAVVVDKSRQEVLVFVFDGRWCIADSWPCSTGKRPGRKRFEGDYKTPEGVYFVVRRVPDRYLSKTYGAFALPLNYPNWQDRLANRSGSAIWLHGTDRELRARDTNGCVVMENKYIVTLASKVQLQKTPIIIVNRVEWWRQKEADLWGAHLVDLISGWQKDLMGGSFHRYQRWYTAGASATMDWWHRWCRIRNTYRNDLSHGGMTARDIDIVRYGDLFIIQFQQELETGHDRVLVGHKRLYVRAIEGKLCITREVNTPLRIDTDLKSGSDPLFTAWRHLNQNKSKRQHPGIQRYFNRES